MAERFVEPVTLRGAHASLEPLAAEHLDAVRCQRTLRIDPPAHASRAWT